MRKTIMLALIAAVATPAIATAQTGELRRDRQDVRQEQRELNRAYRTGDRRDIREERRDVKEARRELREDRRDYRRDEWRDYRRGHRNLYARGNWRAPFAYQSFRPGITIRSGYYAPRYVIADPWRYRLPRPAYNQRWVRHYDDVLLINIRTGRVVNVVRGFYW